MTEDEAQRWVETQFGAVALERLMRFAELVRAEADRQNLVAPSTLPHLWVRHFVDSAQLLSWVPRGGAGWIDIGTGAGFPGVVVAALRHAPVTLVEPRARRVEFLASVCRELDLDHVTIEGRRAEQVSGIYDVVSARAVASTADLLAMTKHLRHDRTCIVLPRGRNGVGELASLPVEWQEMFHVKQSITDPASVILVANGAS
ncbi:16S rRNA (guanine(527)-N(7))-methyltransferase RsmG [Sphingomonas corticis]|jgi:16S rRNA (guanine527-N7)-methyltransferase|uniref:Ribosomal RNA small subunit methyltransferase G n=1 Tax=Sphingomonas corticis TaxID=2722791 RepID=A0ABX1CHZ1_9SPHN|nr:16S rRNA (guanine(527)-N(7))-methyltransferase RsmG [Sphingomonas corticis]NJR77624.1 16S rRNA (guanine(527)-N(7))-methyltransferase RsmG [Sphingomonas corticis]